MNKSVCENCIPKCVMVSSEKDPKVPKFFQKVDFFEPDCQNTPIKKKEEGSAVRIKSARGKRKAREGKNRKKQPAECERLRKEV